ncbi:MAG TPA: hypothetical protein VN616_05655 [Puia sp.]|nr:hypothetical protein [Puia sp.]
MTTPFQEARPGSDPAGDDARLLRQQVGTARAFLFIAAAFSFISAILMTPGLPSQFTVLNIGITGVVSLLYILLAIWAGKRPYTAMRLGLLLLAVAIAADSFVTPFGPFNRWQSKLLTLVTLLLGLADSRDAQRKLSRVKTPPAQ